MPVSREKKIELDQQRYWADPEKHRARNRRWARNNPEKVIAKSLNRNPGKSREKEASDATLFSGE